MSSVGKYSESNYLRGRFPLLPLPFCISLCAPEYMHSNLIVLLRTLVFLYILCEFYNNYNNNNNNNNDNNNSNNNNNDNNNNNNITTNNNNVRSYKRYWRHADLQRNDWYAFLMDVLYSL